MFAVVAARSERLGDLGALLRMPYSRSLGEGLFELRFALGRNAQRITFFFPGDERIALLAKFQSKDPTNDLKWREHGRRCGCVFKRDTPAEGEEP
jgi:hypothetical protein